MVREALWYSLRTAVRRGVHHGLDLSEGRERGVCSSKRAVREFSEEENQSLSWVGDRCGGAGGTQKDWRRGLRNSQLVRFQQGILGIGLSVGGARVMRMGTWSEPVEGRDVVSQSTKAGDMSGLEQARSIPLALWDLERGKRV